MYTELETQLVEERAAIKSLHSLPSSSGARQPARASNFSAPTDRGTSRRQRDPLLLDPAHP